jgi:hypothetical protein
MSLFCPTGWKLQGSSCYFLSSSRATWSIAKDSCASRDSFLVRVDSLEENIFLYNTYGSVGSVWSCLNDILIEGSFQCSQGTTLYGNFELFEPNDAGNNEDCVSLFGKASNWNDLPCTSSLRYICERDASLLSGSIAPSSAPTLQAWSCGDGEALFGSSCYTLSSGTATWSAATDACVSLGSSLVQVDSVDENVFLYNTYGSVGSVWSCLNDISIEGSFQCSQGATFQSNIGPPIHY